jgi:hypothetical protein
MKSWFSLMKSSVSPCSVKKLPKFPRQSGSYASSFENSDCGFPKPLPMYWSEGDRECETGFDGGGGRGAIWPGESGGVGAEECLCPPKRPPRKPELCLAGWAEPPKAWFLVALLAFFSRSSIFFLNCFASFSSTNDSPARHSSSSKV